MSAGRRTFRTAALVVAAVALLGAGFVGSAAVDGTQEAWSTFDADQVRLYDGLLLARGLPNTAAQGSSGLVEEVERSAAALAGRAQTAELERALKALASCSSTDGDCQRQRRAPAIEAASVKELRQVAERRRHALEDASTQSTAAWILVVVGLIALAAVAAGGEGVAPPPSEVAIPEADERLDQLEELYALRRRVATNDRFAALGEVAAGLSHGLKTPLAAVRAAAQAGSIKLADDHPAHKNLDDVVAGVDRLTAEVNRFLRASEAGEPQLVPMAAAEMLAELGQRYAPNAKERGVELRVDVEDGLPRVMADAPLLQVALRNLLENALEASPSGSVLALGAARCEPPARVGVEGTPPDPGVSFVEITVADGAGGIPAEVVLGASRGSSKAGGSGLGFAIARRAVQRHGGALEIADGASGTVLRCRLRTAPTSPTDRPEEAA